MLVFDAKKRLRSASAACGLLLLVGACAPDGPEASPSTHADSGVDLAALAQGMRDAGERSALLKLAQLQPDLTVSLGNDGRVSALRGEQLAGIVVAYSDSDAAVEQALRAFVSAHGALYGVAPGEALDLTLTAKNHAGRGMRYVFQQSHAGHEVEDGRITALFDELGQLRSLIGRVHSPALLATLAGAGDAARARDVVRAHMGNGRYARGALSSLELEAERILSVRQGAALWRVRAQAGTAHAIDAELWVDDDGDVIDTIDRVGYDTQDISITHYRHQRGEAHNTTTESSLMNVDVDRTGNTCTYSLQRTGSGRPRMWNAKNEGTTTTPTFAKTSKTATCSSAGPSTFTEVPGAADPNWVFNEQQAYYWAQLFKTRLDNWGREPNSFGHYEPLSSRQVGFEFVVNGDSSNENSWCGISVMHGCFRSGVAKSFFPGIDTTRNTVPTVYLFNSSGNSNSPQFEGTEFSPVYPIVMHEVGHYVSWTYGGWDGESGNMERSLNEGFSMVYPAVFAIDKWETPGYTDSQEVTTGSRVGPGSTQWTHHVRGTAAQVYSGMDCEAADPYLLAFPFVQAMWHLANNVDESGNAIWTSRDAAAHNTADLMMYGLSALTSNSTMNWHLVAEDLIDHLGDQIRAGVEEGMPQGRDVVAQVKSVFNTHGLRANCK